MKSGVPVSFIDVSRKTGAVDANMTKRSRRIETEVKRARLTTTACGPFRFSCREGGENAVGGESLQCQRGACRPQCIALYPPRHLRYLAPAATTAASTFIPISADRLGAVRCLGLNELGNVPFCAAFAAGACL